MLIAQEDKYKLFIAFRICQTSYKTTHIIPFHFTIFQSTDFLPKNLFLAGCAPSSSLRVVTLQIESPPSLPLQPNFSPPALTSNLLLLSSSLHCFPSTSSLYYSPLSPIAPSTRANFNWMK